jgi:hypothetical protein
MKAFYDKMLVDKANAIGKKFGAKVEWKEIPDPEINVDRATWEGHSPEVKAQLLKAVGKSSHLMKIPVLRLNDKLKQTATGRGLPLFAHGLPYSFTPVEGNPFEQKQE